MDRETMRKLVRIWDQAGPELEAIRRRELEAMTDEQVREAALDLLTFPLPTDLPPRLSSGLVEQQYWFSKFRSRL
ncbi:MAG: hypothetical protein EXR30_00565 [Betaproteobacteria bacterium]|nr:hypothetical protein [Betaproteobacteria bacterium]MSQ87906.1 hypothetical protein [Betaproteobacteria bacterium]